MNMEPLNTQNSEEEAEYTDDEWDAELLSQFPQVGVTNSCGFAYGIDYTHQRKAGWDLLKQRLTPIEYEELWAALVAEVGKSALYTL